jgi:hypothetical protein
VPYSFLNEHKIEYSEVYFRFVPKIFKFNKMVRFPFLLDNLGNAYLTSFFVSGAWDHTQLHHSVKAYQNAVSCACFTFKYVSALVWKSWRLRDGSFLCSFPFFSYVNLPVIFWGVLLLTLFPGEG